MKKRVERTLRPGERFVFEGVEIVLLQLRRGAGRRATITASKRVAKVNLDKPQANLDDTTPSQS